MDFQQSMSFGDNVDTFSQNFSSDRFADAFNNNSGASPASADSPQSSHGLTQSSNPTSPPQSKLHATPGSAAPGLNPRSCVTCRRRKVKCDKRQPCSNCSKAHIECIFPRPGRAPRRTKKPPDAELLARLRRLEGVVQKLGKGEGEETPEAQSPETAEPAANAPMPKLGVTEKEKQEKLRGLGGTLKIQRDMGNLNIGEGRSRYVSNTFWASLTEEVSEMKDFLGDSSDLSEEEDEYGSPEPMNENDLTAGRHTHQEFIFGYNSTMITLRILHPPANQTMTYWGLYVENIDPVVRLLHKPTAQKLFIQASRDQGSINKTTEPLVFAVYFSVVVSLSNEECQRLLGLDREVGLKRFRYATEQALARANFLSTSEMVVVQAFCLFLGCVRRHDNTKSVWTLTGLLMRMAVSLGLHRDGAQFGLPQFQTEMRRRLWWQVCTLDVRASEDQGADPMVVTSFFDTRMPLNVNDVDIWPEMTEPPKEHEKCTEMTFDLVRYEIGGTIRALSQNQTARQLPDDNYQTLEQKEALLERLRIRLEDKYLRHCDMSVPLQWVAANVSRLVMAKIWLVIHHPFRQPGLAIPQETRDRTFLTSIDVIRYSRMLQTQQKTSKWGWLFRTYFQWHAVAFLLSELCTRTSGTAVDEAWEIISEAMPDWTDDFTSTKRSVLWRPIVKLLRRARTVRIQELERRKKLPNNGNQGAATYNRSPAHLSAQLGNLQSADRKLSDAVIPNIPLSPTASSRGTQSPPVTHAFAQNSGQHMQQRTPPSFDSQGASSHQVPPASMQIPDTNVQMDPSQLDPAMASLENMDMWLDDPSLTENYDFSDINWNTMNASFDPNYQVEASQQIQQPVDLTTASMWGDSGQGFL